MLTFTTYGVEIEHSNDELNVASGMVFNEYKPSFKWQTIQKEIIGTYSNSFNACVEIMYPETKSEVGDNVHFE